MTPRMVVSFSFGGYRIAAGACTARGSASVGAARPLVALRVEQECGCRGEGDRDDGDHAERQDAQRRRRRRRAGRRCRRRRTGPCRAATMRCRPSAGSRPARGWSLGGVVTATPLARGANSETMTTPQRHRRRVRRGAGRARPQRTSRRRMTSVPWMLHRSARAAGEVAEGHEAGRVEPERGGVLLRRQPVDVLQHVRRRRRGRRTVRRRGSPGRARRRGSGRSASSVR